MAEKDVIDRVLRVVAEPIADAVAGAVEKVLERFEVATATHPSPGVAAAVESGVVAGFAAHDIAVQARADAMDQCQMIARLRGVQAGIGDGLATVALELCDELQGTLAPSFVDDPHVTSLVARLRRIADEYGESRAS